MKLFAFHKTAQRTPSFVSKNTTPRPPQQWNNVVYDKLSSSIRRVSNLYSTYSTDTGDIGSNTHETNEEYINSCGTSSTSISTSCAATRTCTHTKKKRMISFITDIEGDASYFDRFVQNSLVLDFEPVQPCCTIGIHNNSSAGEDDKNTNTNDYQGQKSNLDFFPYDKHVIFRDSDKNYFYDRHDQNDEKLHHDHPILVCGGDMWDKGGADLYVTRQLLSLQKRYGEDRVYFILGNRDINKMRIIQELGIHSTNSDHPKSSSSNTNGNELMNNNQDPYQSSLPFHGGVYWLKGSGLVGDTELIAKAKDILNNEHNTQKEKESFDDKINDNILPQEYAQSMVPTSSAADRLRWMLQQTMGSPDSFELRRSELRREKIYCSNYEKQMNSNDCNNNESSIDHDKIQITDEDIVASYKASTHPIHGVLGNYLSQGRLALCLGGAMFMHGSLPFTPPMVNKYIEHESNDETLQDFWSDFYQYALPFGGKDKSGFQEEAIHSTIEWVNALNSFARRQTEVWARNVTAAEEEEINSSEGRTSMETMWSSVGGYQNTSSDGSRAFGSLCQYGMGWLPKPDKLKNPTVVYDSWVVEGMPRRFYGKDESDLAYKKMVGHFFNHSNLDVIVTGHQPGKWCSLKSIHLFP